MKRAVVKCSAALAVILISAAASFAETLTLEECLAAAMAYNPDIVAAREKIASVRETINQAASTGRPQISANTGYGRTGIGLFTDDNSGSYTGNVKIDQSISDWGRRETKIAGAKLNTEAASSDYEASRKNVIRNVYIAYYELNRAVRENGVEKTRYDNYEKRLKWARDFYEVGTKAKIEVTRAEADLAASKLNVVRSGSAIERCKAELANIIGRPMLTINDAVDMLAFEEWDVPLDDAVKNALERRPELIAQRRRVESSAKNITLQMKGLSPTLGVSGGYAIGGTSVFEANEWNARVSMSIPISDGGLTKSNAEQARANFRQAEAEMASLENSVMLEVRKAWQYLVEAKESLTSSREAERSAKETLELAQGRYAAGVGDSLEISDAVDKYAVASTNTVQALYDCKAAQIELEKAMGGLDYGKD